MNGICSVYNYSCDKQDTGGEFEEAFPLTLLQVAKIFSPDTTGVM